MKIEVRSGNGWMRWVGTLLVGVAATAAVLTTGSGEAAEDARLVASDGTVGIRFGRAAAASGEAVFVGSQDQEVAGVTNRGAVYVYVEPTGGWEGTLTEIATLEPSDSCRFFGAAVAAWGDHVAVASLASPQHGLPGAVYVFERPPSGWTGTVNEVAKLTSQTTSFGDSFGHSIAMTEDTIAVGAPFYGVGGGVYVYSRPPGGWQGDLVEDAVATASAGQSTDSLGTSVAIGGATLAAGAPNNGARTGEVYLFERPPGGWAGMVSESARLTADGGELANFLGRSVAVTPAGVLAGAPRATVAAVQEGAVLFFATPPGGFSGEHTETARLVKSTPGGGALFIGNSLAVDGGWVVAGTDQPTGGIGRGLVFDMWSAPSTPTITESFVLVGSGSTSFDLFGWAVAVAGETVVVTAPQKTVGGNSAQGEAAVFDGIGRIFRDGFEGGTTLAWSVTEP
ncbi:MAG: FG-GAP repeat protein [Thermoanaerobaculales bacterium]|jgi:hypothetical protein|nr:FG-GAP repeat protein [Thermoanaerobaculales bacterium]